VSEDDSKQYTQNQMFLIPSSLITTHYSSERKLFLTTHYNMIMLHAS
jgi:hypothetical protein